MLCRISGSNTCQSHKLIHYLNECLEAYGIWEDTTNGTTQGNYSPVTFYHLENYWRPWCIMNICMHLKANYFTEEQNEAEDTGLTTPWCRIKMFCLILKYIVSHSGVMETIRMIDAWESIMTLLRSQVGKWQTNLNTHFTPPLPHLLLFIVCHIHWLCCWETRIKGAV